MHKEGRSSFLLLPRAGLELCGESQACRLKNSPPAGAGWHWNSLPLAVMGSSSSEVLKQRLLSGMMVVGMRAGLDDLQEPFPVSYFRIGYPPVKPSQMLPLILECSCQNANTPRPMKSGWRGMKRNDHLQVSPDGPPSRN